MKNNLLLGSSNPGKIKEIKFYINAEYNDNYETQIVRLIHGDTNPEGPGYKEEEIGAVCNKTYKGRNQRIHGGSYVVIPQDDRLNVKSFTLQAYIFPTTPDKGRQGILTKWNEKTKKLGYFTGEYSERNFNNFSRGAERTPLSEGKLSETKSGKPASKKLMGKFKEHDHGYTGIGPSPFNSLMMCNDFATLFTFFPKSPLQTDVEIMWLVHKDAEEGKDYNLEDMIWLWDQTTTADKRIIEDNQKGVLSSKYQPGPLSTMELGVESFKNWYLETFYLALDKN